MTAKSTTYFPSISGRILENLEENFFQNSRQIDQFSQRGRKSKPAADVVRSTAWKGKKDSFRIRVAVEGNKVQGSKKFSTTGHANVTLIKFD